MADVPAPVAAARPAPIASPAAASPGPVSKTDAKADSKPDAKSGKSFWPSFHEVLSALNPLQYVPVVGTLYRSITGDTIPEATRMAGSLVFSGLTSGPIGVATSLASDFLERATGIDPERIGHNILASLGIGTRLPDPPAATPAPASAGDTVRLADAPPGPPMASQLAAYGVRRTGGGEASDPSVGADQLNALELARLHAVQGGTALAAAAYAKTTA